MVKRVYGLDYLRGLAAFLIAIYHLLKWDDYFLSNNNIISKFGIYGVSIFFILSGFAMHHVYRNLSINIKQICHFYKKRLIRIFPLFWFVTIITIIFSSKEFSLFEKVINFTGTFSFIRPDSYIAGGSWSIGVELVFYVIFPFLIFSFKKKWGMILCFLILLTFFCYFAFFFIDPIKDLTFNWSYYVNPLNHLLFFYTGMLMSHYDFRIKKINLILFISLLLFIGFDSIEYTISEIIFGFDRIKYFLFSTLLVAIFITVDFSHLKLFHKPLMFMGEVSYSFYLIHPITYGIVDKINVGILNINNILVVLVIKLFVTTIVSYFTYEIVELKGKEYFNRILKRER